MRWRRDQSEGPVPEGEVYTGYEMVRHAETIGNIFLYPGAVRLIGCVWSRWANRLLGATGNHFDPVTLINMR